MATTTWLVGKAPKTNLIVSEPSFRFEVGKVHLVQNQHQRNFLLIDGSIVVFLEQQHLHYEPERVEQEHLHYEPERVL